MLLFTYATNTWLQNCGKYTGVCKEWTKLLCVSCSSAWSTRQPTPLDKGHGTWDYGHDPETKQLLSQRECSDYGGSSQHIHPHRLKYHSAVLHKCVMVYMGEVLQLQLICSYAHTTSCVQQSMARKIKHFHSPTSIPVCILIHVIYDCSQRWNWSTGISYRNICRLYLMVL